MHQFQSFVFLPSFCVMSQSSVGSTWLWTRAIVWRITTVSWPRSWTHTTWRRGVCYSRALHCRTSCLSSGPCSTSSCPPSSRAAVHLSSGSTPPLPWLEKRCVMVGLGLLYMVFVFCFFECTVLIFPYFFFLLKGWSERRRNHPDYSAFT